MAAKVALALAGVLLAGGQASAADQIRLYAENDSKLNPFPTRTDRYYTNGLKLEWLRLEEELDGRFLPGISHSDWCRLICGGDALERGKVDAGFAIGQNMYTPQDILNPAPQPNDRPWAGHLYGSRIARISYLQNSLEAQRQDRIEVSLGIVGPAALAGETQIEFHRLIGADHPAGWDNQLRNEPILQLRYDVALRWPNEDGGHADLIPLVRMNVGNAVTSLEAEITGRIGWNLSGFGVQPIVAYAPVPHDVAPAESARRPRWRSSGSLFVRGGVKAVAHNIFLDGNSFERNDIRIRRTTLVPEIAAGIELNLIRNVSLSFQFIHRRSEFRRRNGLKAPPQEFGSATIAFTFGR
ncbi:MAG TPA: lipid A deacylase LpxR family protein [Allosphingosinicella sp.]|jgi:hypothetical protein